MCKSPKVRGSVMKCLSLAVHFLSLTLKRFITKHGKVRRDQVLKRNVCVTTRPGRDTFKTWLESSLQRDSNGLCSPQSCMCRRQLRRSRTFLLLSSCTQRRCETSCSDYGDLSHRVYADRTYRPGGCEKLEQRIYAYEGLSGNKLWQLARHMWCGRK